MTKNRTYLTALIFVIITFQEALAQNVRTEKAISGFQIGLGGWVHREYGIKPNFALRAEVGFNFSIWHEGFYGGPFYLMSPEIHLEPRLYYNFSKRVLKGKNTMDNAANFVSLRMIHFPNLFLITNSEGETMDNLLSVLPSWGIRRNVGKNFNFETGAGAGVVFNFDDPDSLIYPGFSLYLRFGVKFARKPYAP